MGTAGQRDGALHAREHVIEHQRCGVLNHGQVCLWTRHSDFDRHGQRGRVHGVVMMSSMSPYDKRDPAGMTCKSLEAQKKRGPKPGPRKLNSKQIRYCVERSQGKTQGESYAIAFRDQGSAYMNGKLGNMKERNPKIKAH